MRLLLGSHRCTSNFHTWIGILEGVHKKLKQTSKRHFLLQKMGFLVLGVFSQLIYHQYLMFIFQNLLMEFIKTF